MARTVLVEGYGVSVGKRSERLVVRRRPPREDATGNTEGAANVPPPLASPPTASLLPASPLPAARRTPATTRPTEEEIPFFQIGEIVLPARGVSVSVEMLAEAAERGISVSFLASSGKPYALLTSPMLTATVSTRREQLRALDDARGAEVCRRIVAGKIRNQAGLLTYFARSLAEAPADAQGPTSSQPSSLTDVQGPTSSQPSLLTDAQGPTFSQPGAPATTRLDRIHRAAASLREARREAMRVQGASAAAVRDTLMGLEGAAARVYWEGVAALCEGHIRFEGRRREGDIGPLNALLNYGYGILYARVWAVALHAGLDLFAGFLHTDRPGKPSLVLDLVEELRAPIVDRAVLAYVRLGRRVRFDGNWLDDATRRALGAVVLERLETPVPYAGRKLRLSSVIQAQARSLAMFLRRESRYRPFTMYW
ncbi:CRISPR-associated endonuclease Cas1 [Chondromyces crocatus]|uniref:CRISPR-associated endonuclease Cas1 n=1 Tax=Chondromyces crocatus TaxID=52 RepID=A0A0K1ED62_CHOCO|nr:CRISPR-associated endonuclease Cas1 [Chondromyces crocatus]AKT38513.1 uncharacterized protein CMC5_026590 [Chondromyces crocatus]